MPYFSSNVNIITVIDAIEINGVAKKMSIKPFGYTTDSTIIISHADILQIIQFTENTHLTEFANTCQEKETKIFSLCFQGTKEFPHFFSKFILQFRQMVIV